MANGVITVDSNFHVGELVKWYEVYADGFLTKDAGYGLIIKINEIKYFDEPHYTYLVYRNKHSDTMTFNTNEVEKISI